MLPFGQCTLSWCNTCREVSGISLFPPESHDPLKACMNWSQGGEVHQRADLGWVVPTANPTEEVG